MKCLYQHIPLGGGGGPGLEQVHRCLGSTRRSKSSDWKANLCYSIWLSRTKGADGKMKWGFENPGALLFAKNVLTIGLLQALFIHSSTKIYLDWNILNAYDKYWHVRLILINQAQFLWWIRSSQAVDSPGCDWPNLAWSAGELAFTLPVTAVHH